MTGASEELAETMAALRREIGPPTARDNNWQPMISAGEVRALLDEIDRLRAHPAPRPAPHGDLGGRGGRR